VISDAGTPTPYITRFLRLAGDGSRVLIPRSFGGLGYAIPAVVGAWHARPDARPVALFGDGSLGMSTGELETLARLNVPEVLIHFNNGCFGWIKTLQSLHSKSKFMSVDFTPGDMSKVAAAYGIAAWRVETPAQLERAGRGVRARRLLLPGPRDRTAGQRDSARVFLARGGGQGPAAQLSHHPFRQEETLQ
jgi:acetolactate synthase-1/2/3 large subunit